MTQFDARDIARRDEEAIHKPPILACCRHIMGGGTRYLVVGAVYQNAYHPLLPVLRSLFFSIHISTIVTAYALLLGIMVVGIITILKLKDTDRLERLKNFSMAMPYPAVALLAAGIFIGAILEDLRQALVFPHLQHSCLSERITCFGVNLLLSGVHAYN